MSELKVALEQAQIARAQKLEYNDIASKVLVYPSPEAMDAYVLVTHTQKDPGIEGTH